MDTNFNGCVAQLEERLAEDQEVVDSKSTAATTDLK
jgi:hypothetical protein